MIASPTVLILGAGASMDFGFPSGPQLRDIIIQDLGNENGEDYKQLGEFVVGSPGVVREFRREFLYSGKVSIDAFLEHRKEYIPIGKAAIAQALIPYENIDGLFYKSNSWYLYLYKELNASFDRFSENKISIVTYNYDRSLEQLLFTALKSTYGKSDDEVAGLIRSIPIIHVHGKLGALTCLEGGGRPYETKHSYGDIRTAQESIKIIHEDIENDKEFKQAHEVISGAKRIIFIGFGYDDTNLTRLSINYERPSFEIFGSCYGFTEVEQKMLISKMKGHIRLGNRNHQVLEFLRENIYW